MIVYARFLSVSHAYPLQGHRRPSSMDRGSILWTQGTPYLLWQMLDSAFHPLKDVRRLRAIVVQFPPWFSSRTSSLLVTICRTVPLGAVLAIYVCGPEMSPCPLLR